MKLKKKILVLIAAGMMVFSTSALVFAATPEPAANVEAEQIETEVGEQSDEIAAETEEQLEPAAAATDYTASSSEVTNKKYLTKGGAAFWFIFTILLNGIFSFWIGNRFYRLAKKDNHVSSEIRALRKDIEEKFVKSVGGFAEQEIDINNLNESLASDADGIKPAEKQSAFREVSPEEEERFRKWEEAQSRPKAERTKPKSAVKEELDEDFDEVKKIRRKNYQPKRERSLNTFDEGDDEDLDETKKINLKGDGVKSKAKEFLGDIFPFKED
ncbi:MAG: hypothetical protein LIO53_09325 [Oscillospiraceae bacterium]|nr:hypothetical protein [Oscillospiraceae bacterium]